MSSLFYSDHFLEATVLLLFCVGWHQVLCEPAAEVFFAGYLRRVGLCVWSTNLVLMWAAVVVPGRAHQVIPVPERRCAFYSALSVSPHGVHRLEHTEIVPSKPWSLPGGRRRAEGERLLVRGAVATRVGREAKSHLCLSTGVDETMCTYLTVFQWDKCWGDSVRARVTIILLYSGEHQAKSLSGFLTQFPPL